MIIILMIYSFPCWYRLKLGGSLPEMPPPKVHLFITEGVMDRGGFSMNNTIT
jgi:hypothetical protein